MKKKSKVILVVIGVVIVLGLVLVALTNQEMRRGILLGLGVSKVEETLSPQEQAKQAEEQIVKERLELLKKAEKQDLDVYEEVYGNWYDYSVEDFRWSAGIVEYVYISIGEQNYFVMGRGEEVFEVMWKKTESNPQRTLKYTVKKKGGKLEYEASYQIYLEYYIDYPIPKSQLSEEKMKELFEKGRQHYLEVRKYFGVDTNEGLEKAMKEKVRRKSEFK